MNTTKPMAREIPVMRVCLAPKTAVKIGLPYWEFDLKTSDIQYWSEKEREALAEAIGPEGSAVSYEIGEDEARKLYGLGDESLRRGVAEIARDAVLRGELNKPREQVDAGADPDLRARSEEEDLRMNLLVSQVASLLQGENAESFVRGILKGVKGVAEGLAPVAQAIQALVSGVFRYNHLKSKAEAEVWETISAFVPRVRAPSALGSASDSLGVMLRKGEAVVVQAKEPARAQEAICGECAQEKELYLSLEKVLSLVPNAGKNERRTLLLMFYNLCQQAVDQKRSGAQPERGHAVEIDEELRQAIIRAAFDYADKAASQSERRTALFGAVNACMEFASKRQDQPEDSSSP